MKFEVVAKTEIPTGRQGKHKEIVAQLLHDLGQLMEGSALKIPLAELPDSKENIRSALNRVTRARQIRVVTSSDEEFLYLWKP